VTRPLALLAISLSLPGFAQDSAVKIRAEIQRVRKALEARPWAGTDFASMQSSVEGQLKAAEAALEAGRFYASLEKTGQAAELVGGVQEAMEKAGGVKDSLPAFEAEWGKVSQGLSGLERELKATNWSDSPLALRAMSETELVKTTPMLEGGRGFATSTRASDGLFYLGHAQAMAEFSRFCAALKMPRKGRALPLRSLLPELQALQEKTNAAFQPPRSIEQHPRFIALNGTLKLARELDAAKYYAGSLYQYLEAVRIYALLDPVASNADAAALRRRVDESPEDTSIAQIFLERTELDPAIAARVVDAFFAVRNPAAPIKALPGKTVELTLVRWPYT